MDNQQHPSSLLRLPAELRARIYEFVFPEEILVTRSREAYGKDLLTITQVNKQLHDEALVAFWSTTLFVFVHPEKRGASPSTCGSPALLGTLHNTSDIYDLSACESAMDALTITTVFVKSRGCSILPFV